MVSQEDQSPSHPLPTFGIGPRAELLSSKFLRKTKFRRKSAANLQPETASASHSAKDEATDLDGEPSTLEEKAPGHPNSSEQKSFSSPSTGSDVSSIASTPKEAVEELELSPPPPPISSASDGSSAQSPPCSNTTSTPPSEPAPSIASSPTITSLQPAATEIHSSSETTPPSFLLSPDELDQAKILVLDLLGWGVDAEYLVTSGVSPAVIFRVFTDLNLQLPTNIEVSDELMDVAYSWGPVPEFSRLTEARSLQVVE